MDEDHNNINNGPPRSRRRIVPRALCRCSHHGCPTVAQLMGGKCAKHWCAARQSDGGISYYLRRANVGVLTIHNDEDTHNGTNELYTFLLGCKSLQIHCLPKKNAEGWQTRIMIDQALCTPSCMLLVLDLSQNNLNDETAAPLFDALKHNSSVRTLNLSGSLRQCSSTTWEAVSDMLATPTQVLEVLNLCYSPVGSLSLNAFARALASNNTLRNLFLYNDPEWNSNWTVFSRLLCSKTSIDATDASNHTLEKVINGRYQPKDIAKLLEMNENEDKADVSRNKVIMVHFSGDVIKDINTHFVDMDVKVLPHAMAWIAGGRTSFCFEFVRNMPLLFDYV